MMPSLISAGATVALFLHQVSVPTTDDASKAKVAPASELTQREERLLFRVCRSADEDNKERCRKRQLQRMGYSTRDLGTEAENVYDRMDLGQNRLRNRIQERRLQRMNARAAQRKTFREDPTQMDTSLQRRSYVNDIRKQRLECMLISRPRPRAICLDELNDTARKLSQEASGNEYMSW